MAIILNCIILGLNIKFDMLYETLQRKILGVFLLFAKDFIFLNKNNKP